MQPRFALCLLFAARCWGDNTTSFMVVQTEQTSAANINAMAKDGEFVYALTDQDIIKADASNLSNEAAESLALMPIPADATRTDKWDTGTTIAVDEEFIYITARHFVSDDGGITWEQRAYQVAKFDKDTLHHFGSVNIPGEDNIPYASVLSNGYLYLGMYAFPGRVLQIETASLQIQDTLRLAPGNNDIRSLQIDSDDPNALFVNCNTMPGRVVRVDISDPGIGVMRETGTAVLPDGVGHILAGSGSSDQDPTPDGNIYIATNQEPASVVKIDAGKMTVAGILKLDAGEDHASSLIEDMEFLYVGLYTTPAKIVRIRKASMAKEETLTLSGTDRVSAMLSTVTGDNNDMLDVLAGSFSNPASLVRMTGGVIPHDCVMEEWSVWSTCQVTCGTGRVYRTRNITSAPVHGGAQCPATHEEKYCEQEPCAKACTTLGQVMTDTPYTTTLTCTNRATHDGTTSPTPACQCTPATPYLHAIPGGIEICVAENKCEKNQVVCPAETATCQWVSLPDGGGRIRVKHGECEGSGETYLRDDVTKLNREHDSACEKSSLIANVSAYGDVSDRYQYHCRHTPGRLGECTCLCYTEDEARCDMPLLAHGTYKLIHMGGVMGTQLGSKVQPQCDYGYDLSLDTVRFCQSNGEWSGVEPVCSENGLSAHTTPSNRFD
jgi:hypothetical protein